MAGAAAAVLMMLAAACGLVWCLSGNGALLAGRMLRFAPPAATGLPESEYAGVGELIAGYLTGRTEPFQYTFTDAAGTVYLCFQPHEAAHMADSRVLILLAGRVCLGCLVALAALIGAVLLRRKTRDGTEETYFVRDPRQRERLQNSHPAQSDRCALAFTEENRSECRRAFALGVLRGLAFAAALAAVLLVWALTDFDGFFTAFHRVAFDNEGWLLNPRTDLLIRLMPTEFFISLGVLGLGLWAAAGALIAAAAFGAMKTGKEYGKHDL